MEKDPPFFEIVLFIKKKYRRFQLHLKNCEINKILSLTAEHKCHHLYKWKRIAFKWVRSTQSKTIIHQYCKRTVVTPSY